MKNSQKLATLVTTIFLLFIANPLGDGVPDETPVFLSSSIKVTPEVLDYSNMQIGIPRSTILTITNVSENDLSVTPSMDFIGQSKAFVDSKLETCNFGTCSPVTHSTRIKLPKGAHQEVVVTVTLASNSSKSISINGDLKVTGEVLR